MEITEQTKQITNSGRRFFLNISAGLAIYCCLAYYLFAPYLVQFSRFDYLYVAGPVLGATGACIVIFKWSDRYFSAVLGGLFYGFSPLVLATTAYHPLAQTLIVAVPWLFLPAVYLEKKLSPAVCGLLLLLPAAAIVAFFMVLADSSIGPFFPMPLRLAISIRTFTGFGILESFSSGQLPFGYYHVGPWLLAVGVIGFIRQHRPAAIALAITGMVLAFCKPVLQVSPVVWTLMPLLFGAILISQAIQWIPGLLERKGKPYMMAMVVVLYIAVFYDAILSAGRIVDYIF